MEKERHEGSHSGVKESISKVLTVEKHTIVLSNSQWSCMAMDKVR